jgi:ATPase subunit of ABC transporter with duplicated ATPase domains
VTVLLRYFVSQVANKIVAVEDKKLVVYEGDYRLMPRIPLVVVV